MSLIFRKQKSSATKVELKRTFTHDSVENINRTMYLLKWHNKYSHTRCHDVKTFVISVSRWTGRHNGSTHAPPTLTADKVDFDFLFITKRILCQYKVVK